MINSKGAFLITTLAGLICVSSFAQQPDPNKGFRNPSFQFGVNGNQIDGDGVGGYNQPGLVLGFSGEWGISQKSAIRLELLYSMKGSRITDEQFIELGLTTDQYFIFRANYASFPILYSYNGFKDFFITAGMSLNVLVRERMDVGNLEDVVPESRFGTPLFRPIDYGLEAGVQYDLLDNLSVGLRFIYSMLPANNYQLTNFLDEVDDVSAAAYHHTVSARLMYIFDPFSPKN